MQGETSLLRTVIVVLTVQVIFIQNPSQTNLFFSSSNLFIFPSKIHLKQSWSSPAHRELGLADLKVTAFWKKDVEGGATEVQEKVVQLGRVEEDGEEDKNKQMFGFNLEPGVWIIQVKSTDLNFASYMGNSVLPFLPTKTQILTLVCQNHNLQKKRQHYIFQPN